jgi:DNA-binding transcriptional regulator YiaG
MFPTKTAPTLSRPTLAIADRLAAIRLERFGEDGQPAMAKRIGVPVLTWNNFECGVSVPAEFILKVLALLEVEPEWLLYGAGPKYRS